MLFPTDWAMTNAQPLAPHMQLIGAITAKPAQPLPQELESFVQSAGDNGVVFASLGTSAMPGEPWEVRGSSPCTCRQKLDAQCVDQNVLPCSCPC